MTARAWLGTVPGGRRRTGRGIWSGGAGGGRVCGAPTGTALPSLQRSELRELTAAASFFFINSSFTAYFTKHLSISELRNGNYLM